MEIKNIVPEPEGMPPESKTGELKEDPKAAQISKAANPINKDAPGVVSARVSTSKFEAPTEKESNLDVNKIVKDIKSPEPEAAANVYHEGGYAGVYSVTEEDQATEEVQQEKDTKSPEQEAAAKDNEEGNYASSYTSSENYAGAYSVAEGDQAAQEVTQPVKPDVSNTNKENVASPELKRLADHVEVIFSLKGSQEAKEAATKAAALAETHLAGSDAVSDSTGPEQSVKVDKKFSAVSLIKDQSGKELQLLFLTKTETNGEEFTQVFAMREMATGNFKSMSLAINLRADSDNPIDGKKAKEYSAVRFKNSVKPENIKKELEAFDKVKDIKGCIRVKHIAANNGEYVWLTPFCDGGTLGNYLNNPGPPEEHKQKMIYFFSDVSKTVSEFHERNMIHADLHKGNLMWKSTSKPEPGSPDNKKAKVIDYGEIQHVVVDPATGKSSIVKNINGHLLYVSPEFHEKMAIDKTIRAKIAGGMAIDNPEIQALVTQRNQKIGKPHDVWLLGVTMFESFHLKKPPWTEGLDETKRPTPEQVEIMKEKMKESYEEPSDVNSIDHLIWEMLRPNPDERPTMSQVNERLEAFKKSANS